MLPHTHHDQLSDAEHEEEHVSADGLIDYIKLIFHTDMGEGHLEHFESGQNLDLEVDAKAVFNPLAGYIIEHPLLISDELRFISEEFYLKDDPFPDPPCTHSFLLRGPPSFS